MKKLLAMAVVCLGAFAWAFPSIHGEDLVSGKNVDWKSGEKVSVLVFLSDHCPCSIAHQPALEKLAKEYGEFSFLGIVSNAHDLRAARSHFSKTKLPFPVIAEPGHDWADALGALNTPHVFVVRGDAVLYRGSIDNSRDAVTADQHFLSAALEDLRQGRAIRVNESRPLGCAIRR